MTKITLSVISGSLKSRKIEITKNAELRPMLTRARCTLFDILFNFLDMSKVKVLDICAGSGILGIESLSRGARKAVFFEINKKICKELEANLTKLGLIEKSSIVQTNALFPGENKEEPFPLVFIDLPYKSSFLAHKIIKKFLQNSWIDKNTLVILATSKQEDFEMKNLFLVEKYKEISNTKLLFLNLKEEGIKEILSANNLMI